jgi:hypothetical protein
MRAWFAHAGQGKHEGREIRTPNLLIWSQTRYRCAIPPLHLTPGDATSDLFV